MIFLRYATVLSILLLVSPAAPADTRDEIAAALDYYAELWNEGDLEALRGYYHADFKLITREGIVPLAQRLADLEMLLGGNDDRGQLSYNDIEVVELGDRNALSYGRLDLQFKDGSSLQGWFSTVYVKTPFGWKALLTHN